MNEQIKQWVQDQGFAFKYTEADAHQKFGKGAVDSNRILWTVMCSGGTVLHIQYYRKSYRTKYFRLRRIDVSVLME